MHLGGYILKKLKLIAVIAALCSCLLFLSSCGGSSGSGSINSGNWSIATSSTVFPGVTSSISGSLVQSGSSVSGVMHVRSFGSFCFDPNNDVNFTGTYKGNTLVMTSSPVFGQVVTVKATGSGNSMSGSYSISGGCGDGDKGTLDGRGPDSVANVPGGNITSGNWSIATTSTISGVTSSIGGNLVQSGSAVSGIMHVNGSNCFDLLADDIVFSGTYSGDTLSLTSASMNNQIVTVRATGSGNTLNGTYSIAGGCGGGDKGTIAATHAPSITGTWKSTLNQGSAIVAITANLTEASTSDAHGRFPLTGTFTFSGSPCSSGGTIINALDSGVWGDHAAAIAVTNDTNGGTGTLAFVGIVANPANPTTIAGEYQYFAGLCNGDSAFLQLTKQ